jgi:hypothetical protein
MKAAASLEKNPGHGHASQMNGGATSCLNSSGAALCFSVGTFPWFSVCSLASRTFLEPLTLQQQALLAARPKPAIVAVATAW